MKENLKQIFFYIIQSYASIIWVFQLFLRLNYISNHMYFVPNSWNYSRGFCFRRFGFFISFWTFQANSLAYRYKPLIAKFTCWEGRKESGRKKKASALASSQFFLWTGIVPSVSWELESVVSVAANLTQVLKRLLEPPRSPSWERPAEHLPSLPGETWLSSRPFCPFLNPALRQVPG